MYVANQVLPDAEKEEGEKYITEEMEAELKEDEE